MAPRANWKGFLRLSLVTCPVALYPATSESEKISFNQLNRKTGHRIKYAKVDADTGEEVANEDIVKGYKVDTDTFVEVTKEGSRTWRWNRPEPSRSTSSSTAARSIRDI
jgi:DNA end-binding protein Ku